MPAAGRGWISCFEQKYLSDTDRSLGTACHVLFPHIAKMLGAGLKALRAEALRLKPDTTVFIPVRKWSDGTLADTPAHAGLKRSPRIDELR